MGFSQARERKAEELDRMTGWTRFTGGRQGTPDARAGQISHRMSLQASLRAVGCLIASFATRMTLSATVQKSEFRNSEIFMQDYGAPEFIG